MRLSLINKRNKLRIMVYGLMLLLIAYIFRIEPKWIVIKNIVLSSNPTHNLVHITDIHFTGDKSYLNEIVNKINEISPDFVCFTGDLVDNNNDLKKALSILKKIRCPIFGVPGNHEYWSGVSFEEINEAFKSTGGLWLMDQRIQFKNLEITGMAHEEYNPLPSDNKFSGEKILLTHYPAIVQQITHDKFDLILAGHSHGGQVRLPLLGALKLPYGVGEYEKGLFQTNVGVLYVNSGLGTYGIHMRFLCRPEITIIDF